MLCIILPPFFGRNLPLLLSYNNHKTLHILGVVLFLGHNIVSLLWSQELFKTQNPAMIRLCNRVFAWGDVLFTAGGLFLIMTNGVLLSCQMGGPLSQPWLTASWALMGLSSFSLLIILPGQIKLWYLCQDEGVEADNKILAALNHQNPLLWWVVVLLFLLPYIGIVWLMVNKTGF